MTQSWEDFQMLESINWSGIRTTVFLHDISQVGKKLWWRLNMAPGSAGTGTGLAQKLGRSSHCYCLEMYKNHLSEHSSPPILCFLHTVYELSRLPS